VFGKARVMCKGAQMPNFSPLPDGRHGDGSGGFALANNFGHHVHLD